MTTTPITLALLAHTGRQDALADFALDHRATLRRLRLLAPGRTSSLLQRRTGLPLHVLDPDPSGATPLGQLTQAHEVQAVIFFRDPAAAGPHEPSFAELLHVCDAHEIPLATNAASAAALLYFLGSSPDRGVILARPWGWVSTDAAPPLARLLISTDLQQP